MFWGVVLAVALRGLLGVGTEGARAEIPRAFPQDRIAHYGGNRRY